LIIGKRIIRYRQIDSTIVEARGLIKIGGGVVLVVVAAAQSKGRGKPGSRWHSPKGNVYFSAVIKPYKSPRGLAPITLLGALAARAAIKKTARLSVIVKWPNDLLINRRKVGGVLTERLASGELIIGIGINVNGQAKDFPPELQTSATSLRLQTKRRYSVAGFIKKLTAELDREYLAYLAKV